MARPSPTAFHLLQLAGALYLIWFGISALRSLKTPAAVYDMTPIAQDVSYSKAYVQGLMANVLNPKVALFFISILPQFVVGTEAVIQQIFILGMVDIITGIAWWAVFIVLLYQLNSVLKNPKMTYIIEATTATALTLVGIGLAVKSIASLL